MYKFYENNYLKAEHIRISEVLIIDKVMNMMCIILNLKEIFIFLLYVDNSLCKMDSIFIRERF